jgi:hypothetical protein
MPTEWLCIDLWAVEGDHSQREEEGARAPLFDSDERSDLGQAEAACSEDLR